LSADHDLLQIVERIILVKSKVMLMTHPSESRYSELCDVIEATYQALTSDDPQAVAKIRAGHNQPSTRPVSVNAAIRT